MRHFAGLALIAVLALAPPAAAEPKPSVDPDLVKSDIALLQDEGKATAEFQRRLRDQVSFRDGVLVIVDRTGTTSGVTVMPATVMWGVDCSDSGIAVTFGAGSGDTDNGIVLQLTGASISDDKCIRLAPVVGATLLAITKGNPPGGNPPGGNPPGGNPPGDH
ncbi:MAG TPA: hypothetical protein VFC56_14320 [Stellaceae bacterium]|nr:hypothetical protein [Stellaceae bacterium]